MNEFSPLKAGDPDNPPEDMRPQNIEAEQALLGTLLVNNEVYDRVANLISERHFFDPVHARIFEAAATRLSKGALVSPVTLKSFMEDDEGLKELGGGQYLVRLAAASISVFAARDYAQMIYDMSLRRDLMDIGEEITDKARRVDVTSDPSEQIVEAEQKLYLLGEVGSVNTGFQSFLRAATDAVNLADAAFRRDGKLAGISTGLNDLDRKLGGLHKSDLLILAGRPSMGKTALATNIAFHIAKKFRKGPLKDGGEGTLDGGVVGFFSLEMSAEQLAARILSEASEVESQKVRSGEFTDEEFHRFVQAAKDLEACPLYIDDTAALPISQLSARARRLKRTHGLDALVVDYLQLVRPASAKDSRVNEISEITQGLKALAKELDIPVIALSQLSRQVETREDKRPQLADLRESGSIEQDADVVMFVFREEYYKEREKPGENKSEEVAKWMEEMDQLQGKAEVIIGKQRHGPIGTVELRFEGRYTKFSNLAKSWQVAQGEF